MPSFSTQDIAVRIGGELIGRADVRIDGVERLDAAGAAHLTFVRDDKHAGGFAQSRAGAVLVPRGLHGELKPHTNQALIFVADADLALAVVLEMFAPPTSRPEPGIHPGANVDPTAQIAAGVAIGAGAFVGRDAVIGEDTVLHPNTTVLNGARLGARCEVFPGAFIGERSVLGQRVTIYANAVIGGDGFAFRPGAKGAVKIPHIGNVVLGNDVEVGASSCIDRAKFASTSIGDGTKIDNLVQIAHNCIIGRGCMIAGQSGLAGSAILGDGVMVGGGVSIKDHIKIGDNARIAGRAAVMGDVPAGASWAGYPAQDARAAFREYAAIRAAVRRMPELVKLLRNIEE